MITTIHTSLSSNASDDFASKSPFYQAGCLSRTHTTSSCWATTPDHITTWEVLDSKNKKLGENNYSSLLNLLQVQGTSNTTAHGRATTILSPTLEAIPYNRDWLCWTNPTMTGNNMQKNNNKGLYCNFRLLCDKGCPHSGCHKPHYRGISCCPETFHRSARKTKNSLVR
jgi:hypothetical protein